MQTLSHTYINAHADTSALWLVYRAVVSSAAGMAMAIPLFDHVVVFSILNSSAFIVAIKPDAPTLPKLTIQDSTCELVHSLTTHVHHIWCM